MTVQPTESVPGVAEIKIMANDSNDSNFSVISWCSAEWRGILAEFISTLMLVLFGCLSCIPIEGIDTNFYGPFGFGMVVMINIQIFGHISGAYMNPSVVLSAVIWGKMSIGVGIAYTIVECAGAILGYGILLALSPIDLVTDAVCVSKPYAGLTEIQAVGIETGITIALIFINCALWDPVNKEKQDSAPIKFGLTIVGLSLVGGPLTGASMNPARSLGPAVWTKSWTFHWVYWLGPFVGSAVAVVIYKFIFLRKPSPQQS